MHYSLIVIILSGAAIFFSDTYKYMHSVKFLAKMSIILVLFINGYILSKRIWPSIVADRFFYLRKEGNIRKTAFACGAISVTSWIFVCALGVLDKATIGYFAIIGIYLLLVFLGILISLFVEKSVFKE